VLNLTTVLLAATAVPYAVLVVAAVVLWRRNRSASTAMIAFGFAILLVDQLYALVQNIQGIAALRNRQFVETAFLFHHHLFRGSAPLAGLSFAAIGLIWYALHPAARRRVS
jgi:hypothetical protein